MWHDIKNGGRYVIGSELEKYDPPIKTTQASKDLGVEITEQKKGTGKVAFLASRALTGDIPYLNDEQLGIANKVEGNLKKFAEITGGEFKIHTDLKLLNGIAEKLYREYDNQSKPSKTLRPAQTGKSPGQSSETVTSIDELVKSFNITNPNEFPFCKSKEAISPIKNMQLSERDIKKQAEGLGSTFLNFEDTSGEAIKPLSTPNVERNEERGKGRS
ncbi:smpA_OmlA domain-containing protein [Trichonephila clavata]|uniref:SmpA_OmlA domain-containing protein n=1 Tax=Trichonephila clavata TaxID=2740835 RepID=A0A8X6GQV8_TRICU|nr:smpA_OmlA domain-containing protein [Trichonephila clavata]